MTDRVQRTQHYARAQAELAEDVVAARALNQRMGADPRREGHQPRTLAPPSDGTQGSQQRWREREQQHDGERRNAPIAPRDELRRGLDGRHARPHERERGERRAESGGHV